MPENPFSKAARAALARMHRTRETEPADETTGSPLQAADTADTKPESTPPGDDLLSEKIMKLFARREHPTRPEETYQEREDREKREWEEFLRRLREIARIAGEPWSPEVEARLKARAAAHLADLEREARRHQTERPLQTEHRDRPTHAASSRSSTLSMSSSAPNQRATSDEGGENWMERGSRLYDTRTAEEKRLDEERNAKPSRPERANSHRRRDRGGYER